jgi:hypothetical protein
MTEGPGKSELERFMQNVFGAAPLARRLGLEVPVFFNHEHGPSLTFFSSVEDGAPRLNAHWSFEGRHQVIVLELRDVRQLEDFCLNWRLAGMTLEEISGEAGERMDRLERMLADAVGKASP